MAAGLRNIHTFSCVAVLWTIWQTYWQSSQVSIGRIVHVVPNESSRMIDLPTRKLESHHPPEKFSTTKSLSRQEDDNSNHQLRKIQSLQRSIRRKESLKQQRHNNKPLTDALSTNETVPLTTGEKQTMAQPFHDDPPFVFQRSSVDRHPHPRKSHRNNAIPEFLQKVQGTQQQEYHHRRRAAIQGKRRKLLLVDAAGNSTNTIRQMSRVGCYSFESIPIRQKCLDRWQRRKETRISRAMFATLEKTTITSTPSRHLFKATTFLWSIQDPVDRLVTRMDLFWKRHRSNTTNNCDEEGHSHHNDSCVWKRNFQRCFSNIESIVQSLPSSSSSSSSLEGGGGDDDDHRSSATPTGTNCSDLVWRSFRGGGTAAFGVDGSSTYVHYANQTIHAFPTKEIMVIRTEYMWSDLNTLEGHLGGGNTTTATLTEELFQEEKKEAVSTILSNQSHHTLCCALQEEIGVYVDLVQRAMNLDDSSRQETLGSLWKKCGANSIANLASTCT